MFSLVHISDFPIHEARMQLWNAVEVPLQYWCTIICFTWLWRSHVRMKL